MSAGTVMAVFLQHADASLAAPASVSRTGLQCRPPFTRFEPLASAQMIHNVTLGLKVAAHFCVLNI